MIQRIKLIVSFFMLLCLTLPITQCTQTVVTDGIDQEEVIIEPHDTTEVTTTTYLHEMELHFLVVWALPLFFGVGYWFWPKSIFIVFQVIVSPFNMAILIPTAVFSSKLLIGFYLSFTLATGYFILCLVEVFLWLRKLVKRHLTSL
jgi:hypothetical protein